MTILLIFIKYLNQYIGCSKVGVDENRLSAAAMDLSRQKPRTLECTSRPVSMYCFKYLFRKVYWPAADKPRSGFQSALN